ncbi:MAG: polysaccharide biosynthesis tyrosine autokinase [Clostridia bacterium]|nr:polysaccharide biosynthesis tyrosine autokinase [Clostridia bacterium]
MEEREKDNAQAGEAEAIDLFALFENIRRGILRYKVLGLVLTLLCAGIFALHEVTSYEPVYEAEASFTVRVVNPLYASANVYNATTAEQMEKTFPQILNSSAMKEAVKKHLSVSWLPTVTASAIDGTNVLVLTVRDGDPAYAHEVLTAVIECYPEVAEFVVGPTTMILLDDSGIPASPTNECRPLKSAVKGGAVGLALFLCLMILLSFGRATVHSEEELKQMLNFPCLGTLPATKVLSAGRTCPMVNHDTGRWGFVDAVRLLRLHTENAMRAGGHKVLLVSSAAPGEGKTTVSANLAVSLAQKGHTVLLIDCDMRNPSAAQAFGLPNDNGLSEFLSGKTALRDAVRQTEIRNLFLMSAGEIHDNTTRMLSGQLFARFIEAARSVYEYIILDTPPCGLISDASEIAPTADAALMVIRQDYTPRYAILDAVRYLTDSKIPLIGCVINGMAGGLAAKGYGYGYGGYGYGYGYGYGKKRYGSTGAETADTGNPPTEGNHG